MDIMEVREGTGYETMNTERKWTIDLFSPGPDRGGFLSKKSGDPTLWRYVIYDDEDLIVETDFHSPRREDTLAFACGVVEKLEEQARYAATTEAMDQLSENLNPVGQ